MTRISTRHNRPLKIIGSPSQNGLIGFSKISSPRCSTGEPSPPVNVDPLPLLPPLASINKNPSESSGKAIISARGGTSRQQRAPRLGHQRSPGEHQGKGGWERRRALGGTRGRQRAPGLGHQTGTRSIRATEARGRTRKHQRAPGLGHQAGTMRAPCGHQARGRLRALGLRHQPAPAGTMDRVKGQRWLCATGKNLAS